MAWKLITSAGAVALAAGFFLTWITIAPDISSSDSFLGSLIPESVRSAIGSPRIRYSGLELASGPRIKTPIGDFGQLSATTELWAAPVVAVAVVASVWSIPTARLAAMVVLAEVVFGGGVLLLGLQRLASEKIPFTTITTESGLYITLAGLVVLLVGALIGLASRTASPPATAQHSPGA